MQQAAITAFLALLLGATTLLARPQPALCFGWPSYPCMATAACGPGCLCLIPGGEAQGHCYSSRLAP